MNEEISDMTCPKCKSEKHWLLGVYDGERVYRCKECDEELPENWRLIGHE